MSMMVLLLIVGVLASGIVVAGLAVLIVVLMTRGRKPPEE